MYSVRVPGAGTLRSFGDQIEELLVKKNITKQDLADRIGVTPSRLSHVLKIGASPEMAERCAKELGVSPSYFDTYVATGGAFHLIANDQELLEFMRALSMMPARKRKDIAKKALALVA